MITQIWAKGHSHPIATTLEPSVSQRRRLGPDRSSVPRPVAIALALLQAALARRQRRPYEPRSGDTVRADVGLPPAAKPGSDELRFIGRPDALDAFNPDRHR